MAESRTVPPLSGEIMAGVDSVRAARFNASGATEGDYEVLARPVLPAAAVPPDISVASPPRGVAVLNARASPDFPHRPAGPLFWTGGALLVAAAFWVAGGYALLPRGSPEPVGGSGVHIASLTTRIAAASTRQIVLVDGELLNEGAYAAAVPALDIAVTGRDGVVTRYVLGTTGEALSAGGRYAFSSRLDAPRQGAESVLVTVRRKERGP